jgi:glucosylceramidase
VFVVVLYGFIPTNGQMVNPWLTTGDQSKLLQLQPVINFGPNTGTASHTITLNNSQSFQTMDGFGWCLTQGSAEVINGMTGTAQNSLLAELFSPSTGLSSSVVRISIGASDLSNSTYSYNETPGDVAMNNFSLAGPDLTHLVPLLKKIIAINPSIKILATPWSAPLWMKTNNSWTGGSLRAEYYNAYARYFVKYFQAMQDQGINIWAITPQNEPLNPFNEPSMSMTSEEQKNFINQQLGPQMAAAGFGRIKIIAYDHNCDNTAFPIDVLNNSIYTDGAAFHLYDPGINVSAMTTVRNATGKNIYFTEQFTGSSGSFSGDFGWHMQNVVIGSTNNWAKTVLEWNLAANSSLGPRTPGGCTICLPAVTINNATSYTRNVSYYIIAQVSKFIKDGAVRIGTDNSDNNVRSVAFRNADGSTALLAYNTSGSATTIKVVNGGTAFMYSIPAVSAVTFVWNTGPRIPVLSIRLTPTIATLAAGDNLQLNATITPINATDQSINWRSSNTAVARVSSAGVVTGVARGATVITATTVDGNKTATSKISVFVRPTRFPGYYNIISRISGKGLDVADRSTASGARIQQYEITNGGGDNQRWSFECTGGDNYFIKVKSTKMCLSPSEAGTNNGEKVQQRTCGTGNEFKWKVTPLTDGYYKITNVNSGKSLDVQDFSRDNGANIQVWDFGGGDNQQWRFVQVESSARIANSEPITFVPIKVYPNPTQDYFQLNSRLNSGATVEVYSQSGNLIQRSNLFSGAGRVSISKIPAGVYTVKIITQEGSQVQKLVKQ